MHNKGWQIIAVLLQQPSHGHLTLLQFTFVLRQQGNFRLNGLHKAVLNAP